MLLSCAIKFYAQLVYDIYHHAILFCGVNCVNVWRCVSQKIVGHTAPPEFVEEMNKLALAHVSIVRAEQ